jgi:hypothetical protein
MTSKAHLNEKLTCRKGGWTMQQAPEKRKGATGNKPASLAVNVKRLVLALFPFYSC